MKIHELGHVVLYVSNLARSAGFYRETLGFNEIYHAPSSALFSSGRTHHELLLIEVGGTPPGPPTPTPGLYHIGFKVGNSTEELKEAYAELVGHGIPIIGAGDHHVTHSIYILDPDNNELELYVDINDDWKTNPASIMTPVKPLRL